jgi:hypothetical protein
MNERKVSLFWYVIGWLGLISSILILFSPLWIFGVVLGIIIIIGLYLDTKALIKNKSQK